MGGNRITEQQFNEAAWNLGVPIRWNDENDNGRVEQKEISRTTGGAFELADNEVANAIKIVLDGAKGKHLKVVRAPSYLASLDSAVDAGRRKSGDAFRRALRDRDMGYRSWVEETIDFRSLSEAEQKAAWILVHEVMPSVEAVYLAQRDPNNPRYLHEIAATGDFADYAHAWFSGGPWCQEVKDRQCSSHKEFPQRVPNSGMWPPNYTQEDVKRVEGVADKKERETLLSHFVDRFIGKEGLSWRPLNANPQLQPHLARISAGLKKAAAVDGIDPSLRKFFKTRAAEFEITTSPFPFFDGDLAWIAIKGGLDVTLGFYETDAAPFNYTALMKGYVGPVDTKREELGRKFQELAPLMEREIAHDLGSGYTPRNFSNGLPPLRFETLVQSGDSRVGYVAAGYYLPNVAPYGDDSAYKKVFISNSIAARHAAVLRPMSNIVLDPSQRKTAADDMALDAVVHENAHGVGVQTNKVRLSGSIASALEEAKADMEGVASLPLAIEKGIVTRDAADRAAIAMVESLLRGLSYGMDDPHGIGAFIEFADLYQEGGIIETPKGFYAVNFDGGAIYKAAKKIARRIEELQFVSLADPEGATKEAEEWLARSKASLPHRMKEVFIPKLEKMPKDVFPWQRFLFSDKVVADMTVARL